MFSPLSAGTPGEQPKFPTRQVLASYLLDCPCLSLTKSACTSGVQSCWFVLSEWIDGCRQHLRKNLTFGSSAALHSVALFSLSLSCVCLCAYVCVCLGNIRCLFFFTLLYAHWAAAYTSFVTQVGWRVVWTWKVESTTSMAPKVIGQETNERRRKVFVGLLCCF